ncbi:F-box/LRR-repeat protein At4g14103-like [Oryza glaberrima]|uniref:F-box/LRR-repeat protein At4g14103-like n=1 Tax=Oryza glaberrima TaxID=4538 RepID=UPI00224C19F3|nr:F-box/LRR-repeat protein At4g14103-like [Oryza glaberrima]
MEGSLCKVVRYTDPWDAPGTDRLSALLDDVILHIMFFMNARQVVQTCEAITESFVCFFFFFQFFFLHLPSSIDGHQIFCSILAHGWFDLTPGHIMSFLDSRQAVQMCVLSQRWRNLWRSMPGINIDCKEFEVTDKAVFIEFVNRLLKLRDPVAPISKFSLWYSMTGSGCDTVKKDTGRWISNALQKQAWAVEIYVEMFYGYLKPLVLDHSVFTSTYLQIIWFSNVILDDGFFKQLEAGCPALEDLFLDECFISDVEISSQTLKVLTIKRADFSTDPKTSISTPSATSLTLSDPICGIFVLKDMASVVTASVKPTFMPLRKCITGLHQYLLTLSGVKNLEFFYPLTIEDNLQWCPKFNNLVNLTLGEWCLHANFYALIVFIENSPRLEKLALKLYEFGQRTSKRTIVELNDRLFTCGHLKIVEVICFKNDPLANHVVDFLFSSGMTSAQIHIKHCW